MQETAPSFMPSSMIKNKQKTIVIVYLLQVLYAACAFYFPWLLAKMIQYAADGDAIPAELTARAVILLLAGTILFFLKNNFQGNAQNTFSCQIKNEIWNHNMHAQYDKYRKRDQAVDFQAVVLQASEIGNYYFQTIPGIVISIIMMVGSIVGIYTVAMGHIAICVTIVICICMLINGWLSVRIKPIMEKYLEVKNQYIAFLLKVMEEIRTVKLFVLYEQVRKNIKQMTPQVVNTGFREEFWKKIQADTVVIAKYFLIVAGVYLYITDQKVTLAGFLLYEQYLLILTGQIEPFFSFVNEAGKKQVVEKNFKELWLEEEKYGEQKLSEIHRVELSDVSFAFDEQRMLYEHLSLSFDAGKCYVLKAPNGFGKSTIFQMLLGIERPLKGEVRINGVPLSQLDMPLLRRTQFCVLSQDEYFAVDTLLENMQNYIDDVTEETMQPIWKELNLQTENKEGDFNTIFSGGQKKKIALGILMEKVKNSSAPIVLLDEPSNMLDKETIQYMISYIKQIKRNALVLIISHDAQMNQAADEIIDLEKVVM